MRLAPVVAALALLGVPAVASAQATAPALVISELQSICVASQADPGTALATADRAGWSAVPDAMLKSMAGKLKNAQARMKSDAAGFQFMMVGSDARNVGGLDLSLNLCAVGAGVTDPAQVQTAVAAMAGPGQPISSAGGASMWMYQETASGPQALAAVTDRASAAAALKGGKVRVLVYQTIPNAIMPKGLSLVAYAIPTR